jgi:glycosyltransferase involved in cell wall biosynthesis
MKVLMLGPALDVRGGVSSVERLIVSQLDVEFVPTMTEHGAWSRLKTYLGALRRVLQSADEVVHIHFSIRGSALRKAILCLAARAVGKPVVLHAHGSCFREFYHALPWPERRLLAFAFGGCERFIALSASWRGFYLSAFGLDPDRVVVLRNPVELPPIVPARAGRKELTIAFLGRIGERKGAYELVRAFAQLPGNVRLELAGDGDGERVLALAACLGVADRVRVHDWLSPEERDALLARVDLFVLPSRNEGLPMAMLEAMGWGLPVVVTPVGGIPEVVRHGENGWLVTPGDVSGLATALTELLGNEPLRLSLGQAARRAVSSLGLEAYSRSLQALYASLLPGACGSPMANGGGARGWVPLPTAASTHPRPAGHPRPSRARGGDFQGPVK